MITRDLLRSLRNDLPMSFTLRQLGNKAPYSKSVEGRFRFQCPRCSEMLVTINPRNNLAHCFGCGKNINNIDLLILAGYGFKESVVRIQDWLRLYNSEKAGAKLFPRPASPVEKSDTGAVPIGALLRQEFENRGFQSG